MALIKMRFLLICCLIAVPLVMADMMADCKSSEKHYKKTAIDPTNFKDWTTGPRPKVKLIPEKGEDSKSYAYCTAALVSAEYSSYSNIVFGFSPKKICDHFEANPLKTKDVDNSLEFLKTNALQSFSKSQAGTYLEHKIQKYCSRPFKTDPIDDIKRILMHKPACVELTLPIAYNKKVYDCVADKAISGARQKYHALLYGFDGSDFLVQAFKGEVWGNKGHIKLRNAEDCGLRNKISYTGVEGFPRT